MKKLLALMLSAAMVLTMGTSVMAYSDVEEGTYASEAVTVLSNLDILNGYEDGSFKPEAIVTRAEFAKMAVEALGEGDAAASSTYTKFADTKGHWAAGYVETGVAKGFINGYDEDNFGPDDQVTYAQAVKMLVAAIGYTTYAENNGGWPSGYLAYGSSLDIINGVTGVSNDTALTRAQCAVLIANTLEAPICKIEGYNKDFQGNWYPNYTEMNGTGKDWQTLLTTQHNAYAVKGRVTAVNKLDKEVSFNIEVAENFEDTYVVSTAPSLKTVKVGDTNAVNMLFEYSEAIIQKDKNTSEYTMISIVPYGATETVEFATADISAVTGTTLSVKKEGASKTTDYKLDNALLYVNGEVIDTDNTTTAVDPITGTVDPWLVDTNLRGTATLVDSTAAGSTSTDGKYDYVMVTYCEAAQVTNVKVADDEIRIRTDAFGAISWDPTDDTDMNVTIIKDGVEISAEDINEDDIILITCDKDGIASSDWAEILVSDKTVSGTATGKSITSGKEYLLVDGEKYKFDNVSVIGGITLNKAYTLYLDAMGYVYDYDIDEASKNIGIVAQMYQSAQDDTPTVVLIDANGDVQTYLTKTTADATSIDRFDGTVDSTIAKLKTDATTKATLDQRFIEYRISGGKLVFERAVIPDTVAAGSVFKTSTSKLGSYTIDETATTILDLDAYLNSDGEVALYPYSSLENENTYTGYVADRNAKTSVYGFAVLATGTSSLRPTSALAVVTASGSMTSVDGVTVEALTVARDGEENIEVLVRNSSNPFVSVASEGSIIMYTVGSDGYVENGKLYVIYSPTASYNSLATSMFAAVSSDTLFTSYAVNSMIVADTDGYTLSVGGTTNSDIEIFMAPVYSATNSVLQILTDKEVNGADTVANIANIEALTLLDANVYTYSFNKATGDGSSVSIGGISQRINTYKDMYNDTAMNLIDVNKVTTAITDNDIAPAFAFVRIDDGDVTDVVFYVAD